MDSAIWHGDKQQQGVGGKGAENLTEEHRESLQKKWGDYCDMENKSKKTENDQGRHKQNTSGTVILALST